jgi:hypothetical protein
MRIGRDESTAVPWSAASCPGWTSGCCLGLPEFACASLLRLGRSWRTESRPIRERLKSTAPAYDHQTYRSARWPTLLRAVAESGLTGVVGQRHHRWMNELLVGYTRVSTGQQDLSPHSQSDFTRSAFVMIRCVDHGLTSAN